jgi:PCRF domain
VTMGSEGYWDALMEIAPVGSNSGARDFLFELYGKWAKDRRLEVEMLHEPMASDESIGLLLRGHFAHGYLKAEAGHHRLRRAGESTMARVAVAPLANRADTVEFAEQRALKATGQLGGKIRSRVAIPAARLVLQNARTLSENRELARDIAPNWPRQQPPSHPTVRRYDLDPFLVRDYLMKSDFSRKDILGAKAFHELLCARIDRLASGAEIEAAAKK